MQRSILTAITKVLRKKQTPWEGGLWYYLRGGRFSATKFKRQVPMGKYVVDFCCQTKKLIIELDGGHHNQGEVTESDNERQVFLESNGYTVLRFWNNEIDDNIEGVLERIKENI